MASRQPERYIPHVRDVFQFSSNESRLETDQRNRIRVRGDVRNQTSSTTEDHSDEEHYDYDSRLQGIGVQNRYDQHYGNYGRTLTEKDLKHIERHLSMKKTIRKQLSRHLTQAFVDSESNLESDGQNGDLSCVTNEKNNGNSQHSYNLTLTPSNVAKSESNFLDLLKEVRDDDACGGDSGHSSPTGDLDVLQSRWQNNFEKKNGLKNNVIKNGAIGGGGDSSAHRETTKSSFWKKLTIRVKSKR